ncbi:MAG: type II secretion system protein [Candidatus Daviesbacteria bacterium]|nr:type II secretion system protein [Candidatus Daviesbacteria bacterium]
MKKLLPRTKNNTSGFTLVELLVVISIIAILSVIGITVFSGVQKNARDARRRADIEAISKALEAHFGDVACGASAAAPYCNVTSNPSVLFSSGVTPSNPSPGGAAYSGVPGAAAAVYTIKALLENGNGNCQTTVANDSYCLSNQQ